MDRIEAETAAKIGCRRCDRLVDTDCTCIEAAQGISFLEGYSAGVREAAEIANKIAGQLQDYSSETGGMEEVITIRNLILNLIRDVRDKNEKS